MIPLVVGCTGALCRDWGWSASRWPRGGSALYGSSALGGVVQLVSRPLGPSTLEGEVLAGSFVTAFLAARATERFGPVGLGLEVEGLTSEGHPVVAESQRGAVDGPASSLHGTVNGRVEAEVAPGLTLSARGGYFQERQNGGTRYTTARVRVGSYGAGGWAGAGADWRLARAWTALLAYTFVDSRVLDASAHPELVGRELAQNPRHRGSTLLTFDDPHLFTATVQLRVVGPQFEDDLNEAGMGAMHWWTCRPAADSTRAWNSSRSWRTSSIASTSWDEPAWTRWDSPSWCERGCAGERPRTVDDARLLRAARGRTRLGARWRLGQRLPDEGFEGLSSICLEAGHARGIIEINELHYISKPRQCGLALRGFGNHRRLDSLLAINHVENDGCGLV